MKKIQKERTQNKSKIHPFIEGASGDQKLAWGSNFSPSATKHFGILQQMQGFVFRVFVYGF